MSQNKYEIDMCNGPLLSKLVAFSLPLMLSGILQLLFNAVDLIVVGRFTGSDALAAVGATTALINVCTTFFIGISLGANVLAARYYACGQYQEMSETVHTSIAIALFSGCGMILLGFIISRPALLLMGTPDNVIEQSILYFRIYFSGMPFFMVYNYGASILRAVGDTKRPLFFLIVSGILNAICNLILVIIFHLGVAGVAIATVFSQGVSCILVVNCLRTAPEAYRLELSRLRINSTHAKRIIQVGLPAGIQSSLINISNALLQSSVNSFGSIAMAGYTAVGNIQGFLYMSVNAVTQACMSFTSQNYGAGKKDRVRLVLWECVLLEIVLGSVLGVLAYVLGPQILQIYTSDPQVIQSGMDIAVITTLPYLTCGIMDVIPGHLRGLGRSAIPMVLSLIGVVGVRFFWIFLIFPHHRTLTFLFISYPASWIITIILQAICVIKVWQRCLSSLNLSGWA